jgi:hypothetical protein
VEPIKRIVLVVALLLVGGGWLLQSRSPDEAADFDGGDDLGAFLLAQGYARVPMIALPTGHYALFGSVGEVSLSLIVDTGASHTVIDVARADRFALQSEYQGRRATGIGTSGQRVESGNLEDVSIGTVRLDSLRVTLLDLSQVNGVLGRMGTEPVDGIIGADVLLARRAVIDYGSTAVYFRE